MIGEVNIVGIFLSPLLLCMAAALLVRAVLSRLLDAAGLYRFIWQRPLFDTALLITLTGLAFAVLRLITKT
ncbi:DUF1656 domain-containing protein [Sphingobium lactosutens]|uniref:DUF1656 domain-containing protein n=1 Tax=Sphingobium lactosutens DS20 TaxID=1331060 RepID=T0IZ59_9SPHN|nr:DUF1656 domain-containing protein [Sphingobium lactosutens]EQB14964.1 hypothetical protein RLDS_12395 [Sphingobium lactosutens DS20]